MATGRWVGPLRALRTVGEGLLDLVYPPRCLLCGRHERPVVCDACHAAFAPIPEPVCAVCGRPVEGDAACRNCAEVERHGGWGFAGARAAAVYEGPLREGVHHFKYGGEEVLGEPLGAFLADRCVVDGLLAPFGPFSLVVPVPLHAARRRERGFNQAERLAAPVAALLGVPLHPNAVQRTRRTAPQMSSTLAARRKNLTPDCFAVRDARAVAGATVLLVDDVFTTGTTVSACARCLTDAGARAVYVVTLAAGG